MVLGLGITSFAQDNKGIAVGPTKSEFSAGKESGKFTFIFPEGTTAESVNQTVKYYSHYMNIEFVEKTRSVNITMVTNDEKSRSVIIRFLVANSIQQVNVDGTLVNTNDLFESYLK